MTGVLVGPHHIMQLTLALFITKAAEVTYDYIVNMLPVGFKKFL